MYFDTLNIRNFGPFHDFNISFSPVGINLITGPNGTGKTQLVGAIVFSLVGADVVDFRPTGQMPSEVVLVIREDPDSEIVTCRLDKKDPVIKDPKMLVDRRVSCSPSDSEGKDLSGHLLEMLTSPEIPSLLLPLENSDDPLLQQEFDSLSDFKWRDQETQKAWGELSRSYKKSGFSARVLSEGQRNVLRFAHEFVKRQNMDRSVPLLIDHASSLFDRIGLKLIGDLLENIGRRDQVIILASPSVISNIIQESVRTYRELEPPSPHFLASLSYNYYSRVVRRVLEGTVGARFILGQPMRIEENRYYEFKEVKGTNPVRAIGDVVDQYAVAFMNVGDHRIGRIYWGVRDADRIVVGVKLSFGERDEIRRLVTERLHQIQPPIAPSAYAVTIHPVHDFGGVVPDLFIVEVEIPSSPSDVLYATGKNQVYVKTDAGKKRLTPLEIQKEILRRHTRSRLDAE
jgi:hypothetical protein